MTFKKKKFTAFSILTLLAFSFEIYTAVPNKITIIEGQEYSMPKAVTGLKNGTSKLKLFGFIPYKTIQVDVIANEKVYLSGETVGIKIDVDGVLVLGLADIKTTEGETLCPATNAGITSGDLIQSINGEKVTSISSLESLVEKSETCEIVIDRNGQKITVKATPATSAEDNSKKLGIWVRGGTTGIGTMTYICPSNGSFGALGHPITDADTGEIIKVGKGDLLEASIIGVVKSERGIPGEIQGAVTGNNDIGDININTEFGIFGNIEKIPSANAVDIATKNEINVGAAYVLSDVAGGEPQMYSAEILKVSQNSDNNKGLVIKITDQRLLNTTGGIVQGMSGSPIIQNGKFAGAITHVFVNDPTRGYGVFAEKMLEINS